MLLQDFTGVPCVVDLAAMRDALRAMGADPKRANPLMPADLVIDHSVQVDEFGTADAFGIQCAARIPAQSASAMRFCAGARPRFRISAWCRPIPASCTR